MRHVSAAMRPASVLCILGFALHDDRRGSEGGLRFDFNAIGFYEQGRSHTESDHRAWLEQAGFGEVDVRWGTPVAQLLIVARKRG